MGTEPAESLMTHWPLTQDARGLRPRQTVRGRSCWGSQLWLGASLARPACSQNRISTAVCHNMQPSVTKCFLLAYSPIFSSVMASVPRYSVTEPSLRDGLPAASQTGMAGRRRNYAHAPLARPCLQNMPHCCCQGPEQLGQQVGWQWCHPQRGVPEPASTKL